MEVEEIFVSISALICEPARAKMLWSLLDGRAYTASELSIAAGISATAASNHLSKLLEANILKAEAQGRHRYYSFSKPEVAYVIESLANLASDNNNVSKKIAGVANGVKYCRTCYDHLAGYVGVQVTEALEKNNYIKKTETAYSVTKKGWKWFAELGIDQEDLINSRRPLTRQCLDWSERRPHLAGQLGAVLLGKIFEKNWFKKVKHSRELLITLKGSKELYHLLGIELY